MSEHPEPRKIVAHPETLAARQRGWSAPAQRTAPQTDRLREIDEETALGLLLVRTLIRSQLRLALRLAGAFLCILGGMPVLFSAVPGLRGVRVLGLQLPWFVLGIAVYPLFAAGGWLYVRVAERNERDFVDVVHER